METWVQPLVLEDRRKRDCKGRGQEVRKRREGGKEGEGEAGREGKGGRKEGEREGRKERSRGERKRCCQGYRNLETGGCSGLDRGTDTAGSCVCVH